MSLHTTVGDVHPGMKMLLQHVANPEITERDTRPYSLNSNALQEDTYLRSSLQARITPVNVFLLECVDLILSNSSRPTAHFGPTVERNARQFAVDVRAQLPNRSFRPWTPDMKLRLVKWIEENVNADVDYFLRARAETTLTIMVENQDGSSELRPAPELISLETMQARAAWEQALIALNHVAGNQDLWSGSSTSFEMAEISFLTVPGAFACEIMPGWVHYGTSEEFEEVCDLLQVRYLMRMLLDAVTNSFPFSQMNHDLFSKMCAWQSEVIETYGVSGRDLIEELEHVWSGRVMTLGSDFEEIHSADMHSLEGMRSVEENITFTEAPMTRKMSEIMSSVTELMTAIRMTRVCKALDCL